VQPLIIKRVMGGSDSIVSGRRDNKFRRRWWYSTIKAAKNFLAFEIR
jgi:hypothetical protein